ncbi:acyltransferase family protein [Vibrio mediterranei]|uniref:acyltransferase family protein n=1 Tax=Vibrio mediterranei TaxID=689 RepID=UPI004068D06B
MLKRRDCAISEFSYNNALHLAFDYLRGLSAIIVFLGHFRSIFMPSFHELSSVSVFTAMFYFITGFGHEAVIFFFFLSGYFIASVVERDFSLKKFIWRDYLVKRFLRFQVILLPALLLTYILDTIALSYSSGYHHGDLIGYATPKDTVNTSFQNFLVNILSLQAIVGEAFGSNSPLWSLSYEFVYYLMYPVLFVFYKDKRYFLIGLTIFIMAIIAPAVITLLPCWLLGCAFYYYRTTQSTMLFPAIFVTVLFFNRLLDFGFLGDITLSFSIFLMFSWLGYILRNVNVVSNKIKELGAIMASLSFSLYLVHMPILAFFYFIFSDLGVLFELSVTFCLFLLIVIVSLFSKLDNKHIWIFNWLKSRGL